MEFTLLPAESGDTPFLAELFFEVRAPEFAALGLPAPALHQLLDMQFRGQTAGYAAQFPHAVDRIVRVAGERAGRLLVDRSPQGLQLVDVALLARFRGQGIGTQLLLDLCEQARVENLPISLSVRFDNPAEHLYTRAGFVRTGGDGLNSVMEFHPNGTLAALPGNTAEPPEDHAPVEQDFTSRYFRTLVGKPLVARAYDGSTVKIVLDEVTPIQATAFSGKLTTGDSFSLHFHGPQSPVLPSASAEITPPEAAAMEIFIVPLGERNGVMEYQAIFNRVTVS